MKMLGHAARVGTLRGSPGWCWWSQCLAALATLSACQASTIANQGKGADALPRRETQVTHAVCDIEGSTLKLLDANGDGRADVIVARAGTGLCHAYDLNLDGGIDSWVYTDGAGRLVR